MSDSDDDNAPIPCTDPEQRQAAWVVYYELKEPENLDDEHQHATPRLTLNIINELMPSYNATECHTNIQGHTGYAFIKGDTKRRREISAIVEGFATRIDAVFFEFESYPSDPTAALQQYHCANFIFLWCFFLDNDPKNGFEACTKGEGVVLPSSSFYKGAEAYRKFVASLPRKTRKNTQTLPDHRRVSIAEAMVLMPKANRQGLADAFKKQGRPVPEALTWTKEERKAIMEEAAGL